MKCSDYFIVKLRYYADDRVLKNFYNTLGHELMPYPKQHYERAHQYNNFYWDFIEKVTGKTHKYWINEYLFMTKECVEDEINESHGIIILGGEGWATFFIPVRYTDLFEWVKNNVTVPIKIVKKTNMVYVNYWGCKIHPELRQEQREHTIEFCKKNNIEL